MQELQIRQPRRKISAAAVFLSFAAARHFENLDNTEEKCYNFTVKDFPFRKKEYWEEFI